LIKPRSWVSTLPLKTWWPRPSTWPKASEAILHAGGMDAYNLWYGREVAGIDAVTCKPREDWED